MFWCLSTRLREKFKNFLILVCRVVTVRVIPPVSTDDALLVLAGEVVIASETDSLLDLCLLASCVLSQRCSCQSNLS